MADHTEKRSASHPSLPGNDAAEWRRSVLYHQKVRTSLGNERKYLGWVRTSLAMVTLGFVVERLDLFLARALGQSPVELTPLLRWAPLLVFAVGAVMIVVATWEFFADRKRIGEGKSRASRLLDALVWLTLAAIVVLAILLLVPAR